VNSIYSSTFTIHSTPAATSLTPSNTILDSGQYEVYKVVISGGKGPFTANLIYVSGPSGATVNSVLPGNVVESLTGQSGGTLTFPSFNSFSTTGLYTFNVIATDTGTTTPYVFNSTTNTITVNSAMTTPSISPTSPATYSSGSTVTFSTSFTGGTPPYTYNWLVVNSITGVLLANALYTGVSATSNSFAWTIPSADNGNTVVANVIVTDSASTPVTVNSTKSGVITISSATCTISLNPTSINFGSINPGSSIATSNAITDTNSGSANAYMFVYGGNWIGPAQFGVSNTTWSKSSGTAFATANKLLSTPVNTTLIVPASGSNTIYFGLGVPGGAPSGAYSQTITIENSC